MENNEILAELANTIGEIVEKKVAEKTESVKPTLADAYKMVRDAIDYGTLENEEGLSVTDLLSMIRLAYTCKYDEFVSDNKAEDDSCQSDNALKTVKELIETGEMSIEDVGDLLEVIVNQGNYDEKVCDLVKDEYDLINEDDVDEEWIFENVSDTTIRDVAKRYVDENL